MVKTSQYTLKYHWPLINVEGPENIQEYLSDVESLALAQAIPLDLVWWRIPNACDLDKHLEI